MSFIVDIDAARALAQWKQFFVGDVAESARKLAADEGTRRVTLEHYRSAAHQSLRHLEQLIDRQQCEVGWEEAV
jgi:hypothetical protein